MDIQLLLKLMSKLGQMRQHERWTRSQLEEYQFESLHHLREFAYERSPFYQRFHKGLTDRPLRELPVLTKSMVMENFDELVTDRAVRLEDVRTHMANDREGKRFLNRYWVTATSGTTGNPGVFLYNHDEWSVIIAGFGRAHEWAGAPMTPTYRMKMAEVASLPSGNPWHLSAQFAITARGWLMNAWMPTLSLGAALPVAEIVQQLNDLQPQLLGSYASMLRIFADEQLAGRLHIHPHLIISTAEVLTDETRRLIKQAWGHQPFNSYGATEGGIIAAERSDHTGLYLFEDNVIFEVVDEQYRHVPPGVYGDKLLITVLFSRTLPLIRYELSDSIMLSADTGSSNLPLARIDGIQGRTEDILHLPGVSGTEVAVHPNTFHYVLDSLPVSGWQVVQESDGLRVLLSGARNGMSDSVLVEKIMHNLTAQNVIVPRISVQHVDVIPKNATGKAPLIKAYRAPREVTG